MLGEITEQHFDVTCVYSASKAVLSPGPIAAPIAVPLVYSHVRHRFPMPEDMMDYQVAQQQTAQLQQQMQTLAQQFQALAAKLKTEAKDDNSARDLGMDLREIGMGVNSFNQSAQMMLQQMAQYIQVLEGQLQTHPQPTVQPRGWMQGPSFGGGGFFGTMLSGLGLGAGMGIGQDLVNDVFRAL
ncbi:MAG TPA: hypothetical protein VHX52_00150 [Steroidobacteraceae bacterium]|nr:hypothetical protein [Steroidobacteraceae bacterium]